MTMTTEKIREARRRIVELEKKANETLHFAEYEEACNDLEEDVLVGIANGDFSDVKHAAELALGRHDEDGGID